MSTALSSLFRLVIGIGIAIVGANSFFPISLGSLSPTHLSISPLVSTPTPTPTPPAINPQCVKVDDFFSSEHLGMHQITLGAVQILQAVRSDGTAIPLQVIDENGEGHWEIKIPWSEANAQLKAAVRFASEACNGQMPNQVEITLSHGTPIKLEGINSGVIVTATQEETGDPALVQTFTLASPIGIRDVLFEGSEISIYKICWSCTPNLFETPTILPILSTSTPLPQQPTFTPTATPYPETSPLPTKPLSSEIYYDNLLIAQGLGGQTLAQIRNFDPRRKSLTSILQSFFGIPTAFQNVVGGGSGRATYISGGDLNNDNSPEVVLSFGPISAPAVYPNIIVVRNTETREILGHSFQAFPPGSNAPVNYSRGELRTAVGDFIGSGTRQIAAVQGFGGNGIVRLFQYTGKPAPNAWAVVGQFNGLPADLVIQGETNPTQIGLTLAAGNLDDDPQDELLVAQSKGPKSQTIFHVLDLNQQGGVEHRYPFVGFLPKFRGNGGIELVVTDLNGDGINEIVAAGQGNPKNFGDDRDKVPLNLIGIIKIKSEPPAFGKAVNDAVGSSLADNHLSGLERPGGVSVMNVLDGDLNPSGAMSIAAGEFDGNPDNGQELVIGTGSFVNHEDTIPSAEKAAPQARYRFLKIEFDGTNVQGMVNNIGSKQGFPAFVEEYHPSSGASFVGSISGKTKIPIFHTPTPTPTPPTTLVINDFTLSVSAYTGFTWNADYTELSNAGGTAWTAFDCTKTIKLPDSGGIIAVFPTKFTVVDLVKDPLKEISLEEAKKIDSAVKLGGALSLYLPESLPIDKPLTAVGIADFLKVDPKLLGSLIKSTTGEIKVEFTNAAIAVSPGRATGTITAGYAVYPTGDPQPDLITLSTSGFTTHLYTLSLSPASATATAELVFPDSIISSTGCEAARLDLGEIAITSSGRYYKEFLKDSYGPWSINNTGMEIEGTGFIADFSPIRSWTAWTGSSVMTSAWCGVILVNGETVPEADGTVLSNIGYLKADYGFENGLVTSSGLVADFQLQTAFSYNTVQPLGYQIIINTGQIEMAASHIQGGSFSHGYLILPTSAVVDTVTHPIQVQYDTLWVQNDLDLYGENLTISQDLVWGEWSKTTPGYSAYIGGMPQKAYLYLSAQYKPTYWPLASGTFQNPTLTGTMEAALETQNLQGVTITGFSSLTVLTPDTPNQESIYFSYGMESWLNVAARGVHAQFEIYSYPKVLELGPTYQWYYAGKDHLGNLVPFEISLILSENQRYVALFQFVDSAVYKSDLNGTVHLEGPTQADVPFNNMQFTSTAHIPGAQIDISNPIALDFWGIELVQNPDMSDAGVMCVKCGEIFLTGAGLSEERHFAKPFYLTWGVIFSSGEWDTEGLKFDYNSSGQQFDGFSYTPEAVALSPYDPGATVGELTSYLQTSGSASFDFFGENYLNILDYYYDTIITDSSSGIPLFDTSDSPYSSRLIKMATDAHTVLGTNPYDDSLQRTWGSGFGEFNYNIVYDDTDQDGFTGTGTMLFGFILDHELASTIVLSSTRICMGVYSTSDDERHDIRIGPVANFGQMIRTSGCACIEDGQLEKVVLGSELETTANVNIALRANSYAAVDLYLSPELCQLQVTGNMYLSLLYGSDVSLSGSARFTIDLDQEYQEGEIDGTFDSTALFAGLESDGKYQWQMGVHQDGSGETYQSIQGRTTVQVIAPIGSVSQEGGFYIGMNAPTSGAWILNDADSRFSLNTTALPDKLTGIYGYVRSDDSIKLSILSEGGIEIYTGLGAFTTVGTHSSTGSGLDALAYLIGNMGVHIWGEILEGAVSADTTGNLQLITGIPVGPPYGFEGTLTLEGCVGWVLCGSVDVTCGLNTVDGFYIE